MWPEDPPFVPLNDVQILNVGEGAPLAWASHVALPGAPVPRMGHTATLVDDRMLWVFGGRDGGSQYFNDVHVLDTTSLTWSTPVLSGTAPTGRYLHTATLLSGGRIAIVGGLRVVDTDGTPPCDPVCRCVSRYRTDEAHAGRIMERVDCGASLYVCRYFTNDVYVLDTRAATWVEVTVTGTGPTPRFQHHAGQLNEKTNSMVVFGPSRVAQSNENMWGHLNH